ncbi:hypothetical protein D3C72_2348560 [compost metagenome]
MRDIRAGRHLSCLLADDDVTKLVGRRQDHRDRHRVGKRRRDRCGKQIAGEHRSKRDRNDDMQPEKGRE